MIGEALILFVILLSFANGSNDVSTGIATLAGSGVSGYKRAIVWGTFWTVSGSVVASFFALEMVKTFSLGGIAGPGIEGPGNVFPLAVTCGAFLWVMFSSRYGLPVSTTHAITGAFCGAGVIAAGISGVKWSTLGSKIFLPLVFSPFIALAVTWLLFPLVRKVSSLTESYCVCLEVRQEVPVKPVLNSYWSSISEPVPGVYPVSEADIKAGSKDSCSQMFYSPFRMEVLDIFHWISAGLTSFARGVNDTPKIAALALGFASVSTGPGRDTLLYFLLIAAAMGIGSMISGLRVTETLGDKVTSLDNRQGLAANLTTSFLVTIAARFGLPVSTTHVSGSSVIGVGLRRGIKGVRWNVVHEMLLAWIVTIPVSALFAVFAYYLFDLWI